MRNPPDRNQAPDDDGSSRHDKQRARTIRDMFDKPLKRLTSGPQRRRAGGRRPDDPPNEYDPQAPDTRRRGGRARWTEPGAHLQPDAPAQNAPYRPQSGGMDDDYRGQRDRGANAQNPRGGAPLWSPGAHRQGGPYQGDQRPQGDQYAQGDQHPPYQPDEGDSRGMSAHMNWQQPDWLGGAPSSQAQSGEFVTPPQIRSGQSRQESPRYQAPDEDPKQQTDYRATSARAALWASRTPSYEPDQPAPVAPRTFEDENRGYFEAYNTRRTPASLAHADASMSRSQTSEYTPGATSEVERLRKEAKSTGRTFGPAPYFWEMVRKPRAASPLLVLLFWLVSLLVFASVLLSGAYAGISVYAASQLGVAPQIALTTTPASAKLQYTDVLFTSRTDHVLLRGWFIPGQATPGHLTVSKAIIMVHGPNTNREDSAVGQLALSEALARAGFAVLTFDLRGSGASASAPTTMGYLEQRDVLGAVDFLLNGPPPYPKLGRPTEIGAWGVSTGAVALLMAAAQEPALSAVVADSAFASALPIVERDLPQQTHLAHVFTPGILEAEQVMYGADYGALAPVNVVAQIAPRPILFIQGSADTYLPPDTMSALAQAAQQGKGARVTTWSVEGAKNGQAYHADASAYVTRIVAFFNASLAPAK